MSDLVDRVPEALRRIALDPASAYPDVVAVCLIGLALTLGLHALLTFALRRRGEARPVSSLPARVVYVGFVVAVTALATSAFTGVLRDGGLHGWPLLIHVAAAGPLVATAALLALQWSGASRFGRSHDHFSGVAKLLFWVALPLSVATAGSMLLAMFPWLGTAEMREAIDLHRYAGLALAMTVALHAWLLALGRLGRV